LICLQKNATSIPHFLLVVTTNTYFHHSLSNWLYFNVNQAISLESLGILYIPSKSAILAPSKTLTFDDAPWISSILNPRNQSIKLVHVMVEVNVAMALGCKSLREQLFSGKDIVCPDASNLSALLCNATELDTINDLMALADTLKAKSVTFLYDERSHPCQSLVNPGLAAAQVIIESE
jgi:hypothetical protein